MRTGAAVLGLLLATLPFLMYGPRGHSHPPHVDHAPRHGGQLFMLGDHHLEVVPLKRSVELYLSDSRRRPLRPAAASIELLDGGELPLHWQHERSTTQLPIGMRVERYTVTTSSGERLSLDARAVHGV